MNSTKPNKCCLCGGDIVGYGHNPYPLAADGRCCTECNTLRVIPARIEEIKQTYHTVKTASL